MKKIRIIGAGLAGSEAALTLANLGQEVVLIDMKPHSFTPAHSNNNFAELVCSNSFKSLQEHSATGLQKLELKKLGSALLEIAEDTQVPAGNALAVDRDAFSRKVTEKILAHPHIEFRSEELEALPDDDCVTIIASGPLTHGGLYHAIENILSSESLYFFDAAAPIVSAESLNMDIAYRKSRYDKGSADYINCPMNEEQYTAFYNALITAELAEIKDFDNDNIFEGCMPIEIMAKRGQDTLRFGPMKPVGLENPHSNEQPYAVVQLRQEDEDGKMFNLVGFQTRLKFPEQRRVFSLIPGLENAEFLRYGVMHRNSFIASDKELTSGFQLKSNPKYFFAGQITGLEGYVCAIGSGYLAAINAYLYNQGKEASFVLPEYTINGQLQRYVSNETSQDFQPMNANFGLLPRTEKKIRKKQERGTYYRNRSIQALEKFLEENPLSVI